MARLEHSHPTKVPLFVPSLRGRARVEHNVVRNVALGVGLASTLSQT